MRRYVNFALLVLFVAVAAWWFALHRPVPHAGAPSSTSFGRWTSRDTNVVEPDRCVSVRSSVGCMLGVA